MKSLMLLFLKIKIPQECLDLCKKIDETQFLTSEIKVVLKIMATEQALYTQVIMIRQNDSDNNKERENTKKYNLQEKSERSICWLDLDHEWLEENFQDM